MPTRATTLLPVVITNRAYLAVSRISLGHDSVLFLNTGAAPINAVARVLSRRVVLDDCMTVGPVRYP